MSQGVTIKGKTPQAQTVAVLVDSVGRVILSPDSTIAVTGGGGGASGNALANYYYIQKDTTSDVDYKYYGYMDDTGAWVIKQIDRVTNLALFAIGASDYTTEWADRENQTYADYGSTF